MSPKIRSVGQRLVVDFENNVIQTCDFSYTLPCLAFDPEFCKVNDLSLVLWRENVREENFRRTAYHPV